MSSRSNTEKITIDLKEYKELQALKKQFEMQAAKKKAESTKVRDPEPLMGFKSLFARIDTLETDRIRHVNRLNENKKELEKLHDENSTLKLTVKAYTGVIEDLEEKISNFKDFLRGCTTSNEKYKLFVKAQATKNMHAEARYVPLIEIDCNQSYALNNEIVRLQCEGVAIDRDKVLEIAPNCNESPGGTDDANATLVRLENAATSSEKLPSHLSDSNSAPISPKVADKPQKCLSTFNAGFNSVILDKLPPGAKITIERDQPSTSLTSATSFGARKVLLPSSRAESPTQNPSKSCGTRPMTPANGLTRPPFVLQLPPSSSTAQSSPPNTNRPSSSSVIENEPQNDHENIDEEESLEISPTSQPQQMVEAAEEIAHETTADTQQSPQQNNQPEVIQAEQLHDHPRPNGRRQRMRNRFNFKSLFCCFGRPRIQNEHASENAL